MGASLPGLDDSNLLVTLHSGAREPSPWRAFLGRLADREAADAAHLVVADGAWVWRFASAPTALAVDDAQLRRLRPLRVYALSEVEGAYEGGAGFGRLMRVNGPDAWSAWLIVMRANGDFAAANSALLSALAPHLAVAAANWIETKRLNERVTIADDLLRRAGITWQALDGALGADTWRADTEHIAAKAKQTLRDGAVAFRCADSREVLVVAAGGARTVAVMRCAAEAQARQVQCLARLWSLAPSEARFAVTLAEGKNLSEAAAALGLTLETARHYSKRLYAKTGARGLPDLMRLVIGSVAMLA